MENSVSLYKRSIAFFVLLSFTLLNVFNPTFSYAQIAPSNISAVDLTHLDLSKIVQSLAIPESLGTIQERFTPSLENQDTPLIIYVQNAHANLDSERSTQNLIAHFQKELHLPLVLLEGGEGKLDNLFFKSFPGKELKEKLLNDYLSKGDLSGGETASILFDDEDTQYYGIENQSLYNENKKAFLEAVGKEEEISRILDTIQEELDQKAKSILDINTLEFRDKQKAFEREEIDLIEYVKALKTFLEQGKDFNTQYPELFKILTAQSNESRFKGEDFDAAMTQTIQTFKAKLLPKLPKAKQMEMNQMIQMHQIGHLGRGILVKRIEDISKEMNFYFEIPKVLRPIAQHAQTLSSIQGTQIFQELRKLEADLRNELPKTEEGKNLLDQEYNVNLLRQFSKLEITPEDWQVLKDKKPSQLMSLQSNTAVIASPKGAKQSQNVIPAKAGIQDLDSLFQSHFRFYQLAGQRDQALFQNISQIMTKEKAKVVLVATGGFHVTGITNHFKDSNTPFVLISPKISQFTERSVYLNVMEDKRSFMKYFNGSLWDALAQDYASKLAASLKEEDLTPSFKRWRDRIIQNSISEGRITQAGSYTKYVDALVQALRKEYEKGSQVNQLTEDQLKARLEKELNSFLDVYFNKIESLLKTKIQIFGDGLKKLWKTGDINPKSVGNLLDRMNQVKTSNLAVALALTHGDFEAAKATVAELSPEAKTKALDLVQQIFDENPGNREQALDIIDQGFAVGSVIGNGSQGRVYDLGQIVGQMSPKERETLRAQVKELARSEVRNVEIGSNENPIQSLKQFADALLNKGIITRADYDRRKIPQAAQQTIITIYFNSGSEVLTVTRAYQKLEELLGEEGVTSTQEPASKGIKIIRKRSAEEATPSTPNTGIIRIIRRSSQTLPTTPEVTPPSEQSARRVIKFTAPSPEEKQKEREEIETQLNEKEPEIQRRHQILEGIKGAEQQIEKWLQVNGSEREWGFYLVRNNLTGELRAVFDLLGVGTGRGTGPYGLGVHAFDPKLSSPMAERMLNRDEEIVREGHTHPYRDGGIIPSDGDFAHSMLSTAGFEKSGLVIYMPGAKRPFIQLISIPRQSWDQEVPNMIQNEGWEEFTHWYNNPSYFKESFGDYRHFIRPFDPRNFQARAEVRAFTDSQKLALDTYLRSEVRTEPEGGTPEKIVLALDYVIKGNWILFSIGEHQFAVEKDKGIPALMATVALSKAGMPLLRSYVYRVSSTGTIEEEAIRDLDLSKLLSRIISGYLQSLSQTKLNGAIINAENLIRLKEAAESTSFSLQINLDDFLEIVARAEAGSAGKQEEGGTSIQKLQQIISDRNASKAVQIDALSKLRKMGQEAQSAILPVRELFLRTQDNDLKVYAASTWISMDKSLQVVNEVLPVLLKLVPEYSTMKTLSDTEVLGTLSSTLADIGEPAIPSLIQLLNHPSTMLVRSMAAATLEKMGKVAISSLAQAIIQSKPIPSEDKSYSVNYVANHATLALAIIEAKDGGTLLSIESLSRDPNSEVRFWAVVTMREIISRKDDPETVNKISQLLYERMEDSDPDVKDEAEQILDQNPILQRAEARAENLPNNYRAIQFSSSGNKLTFEELEARKIIVEALSKIRLQKDHPFYNRLTGPSFGIRLRGPHIIRMDGEELVFESILGKGASKILFGISEDNSKVLLKLTEYPKSSNAPQSFFALNASGEVFKVLPDKEEIIPRSEARAQVPTLGSESAMPLQLHPNEDSSEFSSIRYSPDSTRLVTAGLTTSRIKIWDVKTGKEITILIDGKESSKRAHENPILDIVFSPNGDKLASVEDSATGIIKIWSMPDGKLIQTLSAYASQIGGIHFSPDGSKLIVQGDTISFLNPDLNPQPEFPSQFFLDVHLTSAEFLSDNQILISSYPFGDGEESEEISTVWLMDLNQGEESVIPLIKTNRIASDDRSPMVLSNDRKKILTMHYPYEVKVWDMKPELKEPQIDGQELRSYKDEENPVKIGAFSPDSKKILLGKKDGTIEIRDIATDEILGIVKVGQAIYPPLAMAPDNRSLSAQVLTKDGWKVLIFNLEQITRAEVRTVTPEQFKEQMNGEMEEIEQRFRQKIGGISSALDESLKIWEEILRQRKAIKTEKNKSRLFRSNRRIKAAEAKVEEHAEKLGLSPDDVKELTVGRTALDEERELNDDESRKRFADRYIENNGNKIKEEMDQTLDQFQSQLADRLAANLNPLVPDSQLTSNTYASMASFLLNPFAERLWNELYNTVLKFRSEWDLTGSTRLTMWSERSSNWFQQTTLIDLFINKISFEPFRDYLVTLFGKPIIDQLEQKILKNARRAAMEHVKYKDNYDLEKDLLGIVKRNPELRMELTPVIIAVAWREIGNRTSFLPGPSDNDPESPIRDFINSLTEDEVEALKAKQIPGIIEIIRVVKNAEINFNRQNIVVRETKEYREFLKELTEKISVNYPWVDEDKLRRFLVTGGDILDPLKEVFYDPSVIELKQELMKKHLDAFGDQEWLPNPDYQTIQTAISQLARWMFQHGNLSEQILAVDLFKLRYDINLNNDDYSAIENTLRSFADQSLKLRIINWAMEEADKDHPKTQLVLIVLRLLPQLQQEIDQQIKVKNTGNLLSVFLKPNIPAEVLSEGIRLISDVSGVDQAFLKWIADFLKKAYAFKESSNAYSFRTMLLTRIEPRLRSRGTSEENLAILDEILKLRDILGLNANRFMSTELPLFIERIFTEGLPNAPPDQVTSKMLLDYLKVINHIEEAVRVRQPQSTDYDLINEDDKVAITQYLLTHPHDPYRLKAIFDIYFNSTDQQTHKRIDQFALKFSRKNPGAFYESMDERNQQIHRQQARKLDYNFFISFMLNLVDQESTIVIPNAELFFKLFTSKKLHQWRALKTGSRIKLDLLNANHSPESVRLFHLALTFIDKKWGLGQVAVSAMDERVRLKNGDEDYRSFEMAREFIDHISLFIDLLTVSKKKKSDPLAKDFALEWRPRIFKAIQAVLDAGPADIQAKYEKFQRAVTQFKYFYKSQKLNILYDLFSEHVKESEAVKSANLKLLLRYGSNLPVNQDGKTLFDSLVEFVQSNREKPEVVRAMHQGLMAEARGEFASWRYQSGDYQKMFEEWTKVQKKKLGIDKTKEQVSAEEQAKFEQDETKLAQRTEQVQKNWEKNQYFVAIDPKNGTNLYVGFTDNFSTLLNLGNPSSFSSCQACYKPAYNRGLTGYVSNGWNKALVVFDEKGNFLARRIVRLRLTTEGELAVIREHTYGDSSRDGMLDQLLEKVASDMGLRYQPGQGKQIETVRIRLWKGHSEWDYSDIYGRQFTDQPVGLIRTEEGKELEANLNVPLVIPKISTLPPSFKEEKESFFKFISDNLLLNGEGPSAEVNNIAVSVPERDFISVRPGELFFRGVPVFSLPENEDRSDLKLLEGATSEEYGHVYIDSSDKLFVVGVATSGQTFARAEVRFATKETKLTEEEVRNLARQLETDIANRMLDNLGFLSEIERRKLSSPEELNQTLRKLFKSGISVGQVIDEVRKTIQSVLEAKRQEMNTPIVVNALEGIFANQTPNEITPDQIWEAFIKATELPQLATPSGDTFNQWVSDVRDTIRLSAVVTLAGLEFTSLSQKQMETVRTMVQDLRSFTKNATFLIELPLDNMFQQMQRQNPALTRENFIKMFNQNYAPALAELFVHFEALSKYLKIQFVVSDQWKEIKKAVVQEHGRLITKKDGIKADQFLTGSAMFAAPDVAVADNVIKFTAPSNVNALLDGKGQVIDFGKNGVDKLQSILGAGFALLNQKTTQGLSKVNDNEYRVNDFAFFLAFVNAVAAEAQVQLRIARAA